MIWQSSRRNKAIRSCTYTRLSSHLQRLLVRPGTTFVTATYSARFDSLPNLHCISFSPISLILVIGSCYCSSCYLLLSLYGENIAIILSYTVTMTNRQPRFLVGKVIVETGWKPPSVELCEFLMAKARVIVQISKDTSPYCKLFPDQDTFCGVFFG
jgi:hypothetical protein